MLNKIAAKLAQVKRKVAPEEKVTSVSNMRPMCHEVYDAGAAVYKEQLPEKDAEISITMQIDVQAFINHKHQLPISILKEFCIYSKEKSKWIHDETKSTPTVTMMADSGAQVDIIEEEQLAALGMATRDLLPTRVSLDCANNTKAKVLGVFLGKIWGNSVVTGEKVMIPGMVYVVRGKAYLMSKTTPRALGCLPEDFPEVGRFLHHKSNSVTAHSVGGEDNHVDQEPLRQADFRRLS